MIMISNNNKWSTDQNIYNSVLKVIGLIPGQPVRFFSCAWHQVFGASQPLITISFNQFDNYTCYSYQEPSLTPQSTCRRISHCSILSAV